MERSDVIRELAEAWKARGDLYDVEVEVGHEFLPDGWYFYNDQQETVAFIPLVGTDTDDMTPGGAILRDVKGEDWDIEPQVDFDGRRVWFVRQLVHGAPIYAHSTVSRLHAVLLVVRGEDGR